MTPQPPPPPAQQDPTSPLSPISPWPPLPAPSPSTSRSLSSPANPEPHHRAPESTPSLPTPKEIYGSLAVLLTYLAFGLYLAWAFSPPEWLESVGWTWFPSQDWALIIPSYLMLLVLFTYFSYAALTAYLTPPLNSISLITDEFTCLTVPDSDSVDTVYTYSFEKWAEKGGAQAVDLPIDVVCRTLYPPRKRPNR